jgi:hypothetical protein
LKTFEVGEDVKVNIAKEGEAHRWIPGKYKGSERDTSLGFAPHAVIIGHVGENETVRYVDDNHIVRYQRCDQDQANANGVKHAAEIKAQLILYMSKILLPEHRFEVRIEDDGIIMIVCTDITIDPTVTEQNSIAGFMDVLGWEVNRWRTVSGYPAEPDDVQSASAGIARTPHAAARIAFSALMDGLTENVFDGQVVNGGGFELTDPPNDDVLAFISNGEVDPFGDDVIFN